jgi:ATP-dependent DNA helicase RecQ
LQPTVPLLALTATATSTVVDDIQEQLLFRSKNVIQKSFERTNVTYNVALTNNKLNRIEASLRKNEGSGIIYSGTRRKVKELYLHLNAKQIAVDYYHAGLTYEDRKRKQARWTTNEVDLIVATNAFGMGIDKPDVRYVLHYDIPASLEAYFQEAGRAGRDGKPAVANLFYETEDIHRLKEQVELKYPPLETIKRIYNALGNHLQLAYGSGKGETYPVDLALFSDKYSQPLMLVYNALKFLERCEFIELSENYKVPSQIKMTTTQQELYNYQVKDPVLNTVIQFILRTEMGVFENYQTIYETKIAAKINLPVQTIVDKLTLLNSLKLIDYIPRTELPLITYMTERLTDQNLSISPRYYHNRKEVAQKKMEAMIHFLTEEKCTKKCFYTDTHKPTKWKQICFTNNQKNNN